MRKVVSREYKLMIDPSRFKDRKASAASFLEEVKDFVQPLGVRVKGSFSSVERRKIVFLDSEDFTLRRNGLILRRRVETSGQRQYTLKCRTPDRYIADGIDLTQANGLEGKDKFEEDIGLPFVSRFSHSNTVGFNDDDAEAPGNLADAANIFPCLAGLRLDGRPCSPKTKLRIVNNVKVAEQVFTGLTFRLNGIDETVPAEVAIILWSNGKTGRVLLAEFSFRYESKKETFSPSIAKSAKDLFELLQRMDWVAVGSMTKTEYVYRTSGTSAI